MFATSRYIQEIIDQFRSSVKLEISASDADVQLYLDGNISQLPPFVRQHPDLIKEITTVITKKAAGMYVNLTLKRIALTLLGSCLHGFILIL
jgi:hypothetical protein